MLLIAPNRRQLLACGLAASLVPSVAAARSERRLVFEVFRNGVSIGRHDLRITRAGEVLTASSEVEMTLRLGPAPILRYRHQATERWEAGRFASLDTATMTNGRRQRVSARATASGVRIDTGSGAHSAPAGASPLTHWNQQVLSGPLFNPQDGKLLKIEVRRAAPDKWEIRGETEIDNWYDASGDWAALRGKLPDGSTIRYRRI